MATFFVDAAEREVRAEVLERFPQPIAQAYARLHDEMDRQEPVSAAWQLRDAYEVTIRFLACLALADLIATRPAREAIEEPITLLFKPQGLSLGDWVALLRLALRAPAGATARCLPELSQIFFADRNPSPLLRSLAGDEHGFVAWRNRVFGHGVFQQERAYYAQAVHERLPTLHKLLDALVPLFKVWGLTTTVRGVSRPLVGAEHVSLHDATHVPDAGAPDPAAMRSSAGAELAFGPLLGVHRCAVCGERHIFFLDRLRYQESATRYRTDLLDYALGHIADLRAWDEVDRLAGYLPTAFRWQRGTFDADEAVEGVRIAFRDFDAEYERPAAVLDRLWGAIEGLDRGYVLLEGPGGVGKSFVVRGLARHEEDRGVPVLAYYIQPGTVTDYRVFVTLLADEAARSLRFRTQEIQTQGGAREQLQREFAAFAAMLMRANHLASLVIALDAIDELPDPEPSGASILDFLPPASQLPPGCVVLLSSRHERRPHVEAVLERLRREAPGGCFSVPLTPEDAGQRVTIRAYLHRTLPEPLRRTRLIERLIERSGGVFLYAHHLAAAISSGAFSDTEDLPEPGAFYPAYLHRLAQRVGQPLYDAVYEPALLLLAAARQPVSLAQLQAWGLPGDRLRFALLNLADFLRVHRRRLWHDSLAPDDGEPRYALAHDAFLRFLSADPHFAARLAQAHETIVRSTLARRSLGWDGLDLEDQVDLYDLRYLPGHAALAATAAPLLSTAQQEGLAGALLANSDACWRLQRYVITADLCAHAVAIYRHMVEQEGRAELAHELARALNNLGTALQDLGKLEAAQACKQESVALYRRMVEQEGRAELVPNLVLALSNLGLVLRALGKLEAAQACHLESVAFGMFLGVKEGRTELANILATAFNDLGQVQQALGELQDAQTCCQTSVVLYRLMVEQEGRTELARARCIEVESRGLSKRSEIVENHTLSEGGPYGKTLVA